MSKPFLGKNFLLDNEFAVRLYHDFAKDLPIIDYHNHLSPKEIAADRQFENVTQIWLNGDHYKWRAMRANGIHERFITGDATDWEKFEKWAETVPFTLRNPLYHWTHLELRRYFGIDILLKKETAREVFDECNRLLATPAFSVRNLLRKMNVEVVCTTDDPTDDLRFHQEVLTDGFEIKMLPAFRPDKAILIENEGFVKYIERLGAVADTPISNLQNLLEALQKRVDFFHENGCRLSDHGLERIPAADFTDATVDGIFRRRLKGESISPEEALQFQSALLFYASKMYHAKGWVQQFHLGALRNQNTRLLRQLGPDTGFDSIGDFSQATSLGRFLDRLDNENCLAKTILYNLNPRDNEVFATMAGNFNDGSVAGKMQYGSAWWFLDQLDGMEKQINVLSNMGLLPRFVGMLTDSRSFLSFPRHEYFRRLLCHVFGRDVERGHLPDDLGMLGEMVRGICYGNAKRYFGF
ncbi:MAG: glucuronate isomerase [Saprospiraceae bacterium]|nr:glucuronate isomerase [Saprospiraceae bacterium]MCF8252018.1 glucuronate isomerase [Saprospiraceae bacterium]MCF8281707.1 glucuronate isomerase [Bacteroidales bacterium]MCF8313695.1 glucuronate isomerase [Saprospiraceae bacterium]MCF8442402.1 glucuronate isomerase [Saprospiraceae bacterium]